MAYLKTDDGALAYVDAGAGAPIVLLHGGFLDHRMWDGQIPALAENFRVIAPDARGHGDSANGTVPFRPADDVAAILTHLGTGPALLVGVSMGAGTAVDVALEHPELVKGLIVSGAGTSEPEFVDGWTGEQLARFWQALSGGDVEGGLAAFAQFAAGPGRSLDELDPTIVDRLNDMTLKTLLKHRPDEPDLRIPVTDTWRRAAGIKVPVMAIIGGADSDDHRGMAERLALGVADGRVVTIEGTAHYPNMERPEIFTKSVVDFTRLV